MAGLGTFHSPLAPTLTHREAEALEFIQAQLKDHGIPPTFDEIGAATGTKSKSHVHKIVRALERKGLLRCLPRRARGIEVIHPEDHYSADCLCPSCGWVRYRQALKLVNAIKNDVPADMSNSLLHRRSNLRIPAVGKLAALVGAAVLPTGSGAAR